MRKITSRRMFMQKTALATTGIAFLSSGFSTALAAEIPFQGYNPYAEYKTDLRKNIFNKHLEISGKIYDTNKQPISNATVEVWHLSPQSKKYRHRAKLITNARGEYSFKTDEPNNTKGRAPRVFFKVSNGTKSYFTELITGEHAYITSQHYQDSHDSLGSALMPTTKNGIYGKKINFNISI